MTEIKMLEANAVEEYTVKSVLTAKEASVLVYLLEELDAKGTK